MLPPIDNDAHYKAHNQIDLFLGKFSANRNITTFVAALFSEQVPHPVGTQSIQLIDCSQNAKSFRRVRFSAKLYGFEQSI
jgi:hypothetical protein